MIIRITKDFAFESNSNKNNVYEKKIFVFTFILLKIIRILTFSLTVICFFFQVKTAAAVGGAALAGVGIVALGAAIFSLFQENSEKRHHK